MFCAKGDGVNRYSRHIRRVATCLYILIVSLKYSKYNNSFSLEMSLLSTKYLKI